MTYKMIFYEMGARQQDIYIHIGPVKEHISQKLTNQPKELPRLSLKFSVISLELMSRFTCTQLSYIAASPAGDF